MSQRMKWQPETVVNSMKSLSPKALSPKALSPSNGSSAFMTFKKVLVHIRSAFRSILNFSTLGRTIFISNMIALVFLMLGILYLNQLRAGLIGAKVESLKTQGEIIAGAIAASATADTDQIIVDPDSLLETGADGPLIAADAFTSLEFPIDPERVAPILKRLVQPTGTRARIYDSDQTLIIDSQRLYSGGVRPKPLPKSITTSDESLYTRIEQAFKRILFYSDLPLYKEDTIGDGQVYDEVGAASAGASTPMVRLTKEGKHIVSVAVPITRLRRVLGVLLLSTKGGGVEQTIRSERRAILRLAFLAFCVSLLTSLFLTRYIALPMRRLSAAANRVGESIKAREEIPDYTDRNDEIGQLSGSFREMTAALYRRLDAIETFAADVAHELKNPLTSLRSAAETLDLVKNDEQRNRLIDVIQNDVKRMDRLISDISDASRLDAELAREDTDILNIKDVLEGTLNVFNDIHRGKQVDVHLQMFDASDERAYLLRGHDSRLGQVLINLLENALSFSPEGGNVWVTAKRETGKLILFIDDEGPGIPPEHLKKIFKRFYTDRPDGEEFGNNSGLGLSISRQIISAHRGSIKAENRYSSPGQPPTETAEQIGERPPLGARFVIELPAIHKL